MSARTASILVILLLVSVLPGCKKAIAPPAEEAVVMQADTAQDRLREVVMYHHRDTSWLVYSKKTVVYDTDGREAEERTYRREDQEWVLTGRATFTYDEAGRRIQSFSEHHGHDGWVNEGRTVMLYDSLAHLVETGGQSWHLADGRWVPATRMNHTYDEYGRLLTTLKQRPYYGSDGEQEHVGADSTAQGAWFNNALAVYHYEAAMEPIMREGYVWQDGAWGQAERYVYRYDDAARIIEYLLEEPAEEGWRPASRTTFIYDAADRLAQAQTQRWEDGTWTTTSRSRYRYE